MHARAPPPAEWLTSPASIPHEILSPAFEATPLPVASWAFRRAVHRLRQGLPLTVTAIGQSNTVWWAGCFGSGCEPSIKSSSGWGHSFMRLLNSTWPHRQHSFFNRAYGASSPKAVATCLGGHLAPFTDLLLVDFNTMRWSAEEQERIARTATLLPRPPFVVFVGFPNWCSGERLPVVRQLNETGSQATHRTREMAYELCRLALAAGNLSADRDPIGESVARVARHYNMMSLSLFDLIMPFIRARHRSFYPPNRFTADGGHGIASGPHRSSPYYDAAAAALFSLMHTAVRAVKSVSDVSNDMPIPSGGISHAVPPQLLPGAGRHFMLSCYEWLHPNLRAPHVLRNITANVAPTSGWHVSEYTMQAMPRRKPGLLSLSRGDEVTLALEAVSAAGTAAAGDDSAGSTMSGAVTSKKSSSHANADRRRGNSSVCIGLTHLRSYEGMARARVECAGACACEVIEVDGLTPTAHASIFHTTEVRVTLERTRAHGKGKYREDDDTVACAVRLANIGRPGSDDGTSAKFRLSGVYVRLPEPPCETDVGTRHGDEWWSAAINRVPLRNGMEPV